MALGFVVLVISPYRERVAMLVRAHYVCYYVYKQKVLR